METQFMIISNLMYLLQDMHEILTTSIRQVGGLPIFYKLLIEHIANWIDHIFHKPKANSMFQKKLTCDSVFDYYLCWFSWNIWKYMQIILNFKNVASNLAWRKGGWWFYLYDSTRSPHAHLCGWLFSRICLFLCVFLIVMWIFKIIKFWNGDFLFSLRRVFWVLYLGEEPGRGCIL